MSDEAQTGSTETGDTATHTTSDAKPDTATPAERDWKAEAEKWQAMSRETEKKAKANAAAASRLAELEEAQKSEAQKAAERSEAAEKRAAESERALARYRVAVAKGVPADLVDRLRGDTEDEIAADADALLALVKPSGAVKADRSQGTRATGDAAPDMNTLLRAAAGRG